MNKDVTALFQAYRECARHIRNTHFSTVISKDWDTVESFDQTNEVLFKQMVVYRLEERYSQKLETAITDKRIRIVPNSLYMPLMIGREKGRCGYWDHPIKEIEPGFAIIAFDSYFDWDAHDLIDYRYYKGYILESVRYPEIAGHEVLVETIYGKLEYEMGDV